MPAALGREDAEPRLDLARCLALAQQIGEDRLEQVDRDEHVAGKHLVLGARVVDQKRSHAEELAVAADQGCPSPVEVGR